MRQDYDIVGGYDFQRVTSICSARSVNLFPYVDRLGKKPKVLLPTSGLKNTGIVFSGATGGFRGTQFIFNAFMYSVIGQRVYRQDITLAPLMINTPLLTTAVGHVGIDANTFQIIFVDGQHGYIWDTTTNVWTQITDPAFPSNPIDVCYLDGFFIVADGGTNNFQLSSFNNGLVWGPTGAVPSGNAFTATSGGSPNLVLGDGTTLNYQVGTPIQFVIGTGPGVLPIGTPPINTTDTFYVTSVVNATTFTISATNGGTNITFSTTGTPLIYVTNNGQLQLGAITTHPGTIVACRTLHRRLFLFSQNFTEVWENAGAGTNLPFRRNNALLMEYGCPAIGSIKVGFDKMFFLSQDKDGLGSVMMVVGTESIPISNRALDFALANYASNTNRPIHPEGVADAVGILIKENGLIFYRLNFTLANHTYVYDVTQSDPSEEEGKIWHEEETLAFNRHVAQTHGYFFGINYVGHYSLPIMYIIDDTFVTNDGEAIRRMRIPKPFTIPEYNRIRIDRFHLDLVQGQNENPGVNIAPEVFLSISKDGGQSYGNEIKAPMGLIGERSFRTVWRKLGTIPRGQSFVVKIQFFNQIPFVILGAAWDFEKMPE